MTAPRWIAEAIDASQVIDEDPHVPFGVTTERIAAALIERLPMEAMTAAIRERIAGVGGITGDWIGAIAGLAVFGVMHTLSDADPEVVELTELYQGACRILDAAGAPYETGGGEQLSVRLNLAGRILWLAEQRPTRLDLQRVEAERDEATRLLGLARAALGAEIALRASIQEERDAAVARDLHAEALAERRLLSLNELTHEADALVAERDAWHRRYDECIVTITANQQSIAALIEESEQRRRELEATRRMATAAVDDLDRERRAHQNAMGEAAATELRLQTILDEARHALTEIGAIAALADPIPAPKRKVEPAWTLASKETYQGGARLVMRDGSPQEAQIGLAHRSAFVDFVNYEGVPGAWRARAACLRAQADVASAKVASPRLDVCVDAYDLWIRIEGADSWHVLRQVFGEEYARAAL